LLLPDAAIQYNHDERSQAMGTREIEKRLTAVEREIARLKATCQSTHQTHPVHALEKIHGTFENDEAFQEATRLGRKWRESQRPNVRKSKAKRR
jgi:hypothetical protein